MIELDDDEWTYIADLIKIRIEEGKSVARKMKGQRVMAYKSLERGVKRLQDIVDKIESG